MVSEQKPFQPELLSHSAVLAAFADAGGFGAESSRFVCLPDCRFCPERLFYPPASFDEVSRPVLRHYLWGCLAVVLLLAASLLLFRRLGIPYDYAGACTYLEHLRRPGGLHYLAAVLLIVSLLYMLGIAPFHFWYADVLGGSVLPAGTYLTFIPPLAYLAVLVNLLSNVFFRFTGSSACF